MLTRIVLFMTLLACAGTTRAEEPYIDVGACPGEGCGYGETLRAKTTVHLRSAPQRSARVVATVAKGTNALTLTGEVHTVPGHFTVTRAHDRFQPGDEVWLYTYLGEGWFRLRHNGELTEADLNFSPWGGSSGKRCEADARCFGVLESPLEFTWWVRVRGVNDGAEGWVAGLSEFESPEP